MMAALLLGSVGAAAQERPPAPASQGDSVARVIQGIISYTYWPTPPRLLQFCIIGATRYRQQLLTGIRSAPGRPMETLSVENGNAMPAHMCDILYFGANAAPTRQTLPSAERPSLTISEHDPACRGGAMFCLKFGANGVSFDLNLDAVARSGLRVDPKVLMLGRERGAP